MFAVSPYQSTLDSFRSEFAPLGGIAEGGKMLSIPVGGSINSSGLLISDNIVTASAKEAITCYRQAVVAAPIVIMTSMESIHLGIDVREAGVKPVRIYAPKALQLSAPTIELGAVKFSSCDMPSMICKVVKVYDSAHVRENVDLVRRAVVGEAELRIIPAAPSPAAAAGGGSSTDAT